MSAENLKGRTPVVIAQGAMMGASETNNLAAAFNNSLASEFYAETSPIPLNVGTSYEQGEKLADQMIHLYDLTQEPGIGIGHSKGGIDWIYAVTSLRRRDRLNVLKSVYFISTPLDQDNAFNLSAMPLVIGADLFEAFFDRGHLIANDFRSSSLTRQYLSGSLPESDAVEYITFYNPSDHVIQRRSMVGHSGVRKEIPFAGHPSHIHQLQDEGLTKKILETARRARRIR